MCLKPKTDTYLNWKKKLWIKFFFLLDATFNKLIIFDIIQPYSTVTVRTSIQAKKNCEEFKVETHKSYLPFNNAIQVIYAAFLSWLLRLHNYLYRITYLSNIVTKCVFSITFTKLLHISALKLLAFLKLRDSLIKFTIWTTEKRPTCLSKNELFLMYPSYI